MRLRAMGLGDTPIRLVSDREVGRWGLWHTVVDGECTATFMTHLYLRDALDAGLVVIPSPDIEVVGLFAQACLAELPEQRTEDFSAYVKATLHALRLIKRRPDAAFEIAREEPMKRMGVTERGEMRRRFDAIVAGIREWPYPSAEAIANHFESIVAEYPEAASVDPMSVWDLSWVREVEADGFFDRVEI